MYSTITKRLSLYSHHYTKRSEREGSLSNRMRRFWETKDAEVVELVDEGRRKRAMESYIQEAIKASVNPPETYKVVPDKENSEVQAKDKNVQ